MENRTRFYEINVIEKTIFKLSMITTCVIVGNIYLVLQCVFYVKSFILPKNWIVFNVLLILIIGGILVVKMKLNHLTILSFGFYTLLLFPISWKILPIKIPQDYIGLRKTDETGYVIADEYCKKNCNITTMLIKQDYYEERKFYSWRYAELLGRSPSDDSCCYNQALGSKYFFGILVLLELTFEYLPLIFILTLLVTIYEYYKRKDLNMFSKDFISVDEFDIRKINVFGLSIIVIIVLYNIKYMGLI